MHTVSLIFFPFEHLRETRQLGQPEPQGVAVERRGAAVGNQETGRNKERDN